LTRRIDPAEKYAECGVFGHAWDDEGAPSSWKPEFGWGLVAVCMRCTTERRDVIGSLGQVIQRSYWHPDDYSYHGGQRPSRADFRLALKAKRERQARARKKATNVVAIRKVSNGE